jgi:hypothetical protein
MKVSHMSVLKVCLTFLLEKFSHTQKSKSICGINVLTEGSQDNISAWTGLYKAGEELSTGAPGQRVALACEAPGFTPAESSYLGEPFFSLALATWYSFVKA